ncbi:unnamed protein product [Porites evermanni]|uniref:Uncharacterized protein n=1 Tax=Porites evermanni TaxID=104178 RepID=A0ABN8M681_9CNID|nr:unnamed protein product [Porites evermanni]
MADWPIVKFWLCVMSSYISWTGKSLSANQVANITVSCKAGEKVKESLIAASGETEDMRHITTVTKTTTRKKGGTGDKRDALELKTSGKRVRRMMEAIADAFKRIVEFYASDYDSDFDSVAGENQPLTRNSNIPQKK